jgi:hypothetical protein
MKETTSMDRIILWWTDLTVRTRADEEGLTTAELLGNAALGILALVAVWAAMRKLGVDIVSYIRTQTIK